MTMGGPKKPLVIVQAYEDRQINNYSRVSTLPRDSISPNKSNGISPTDLPKRNLKPPDQPPPPPPMPANDKNGKQEMINKTAVTHTKPRAPPPPPLKKFLTNGVHNNHQQDKPLDKPPTTPTPDYDTSNVLIKVTNKPPPAKQNSVEMESLESFKLNNPSAVAPKPPSTYFMKQQNGTLTMKKASQQISVTIGEYPTNTFRKQPSKLGFLNGDTVDGNNFSNNEPVGSRLQSELTQMLSRSNLKKKTESENKLMNQDIMKLSDNPFDSSLDVGDEPNANFNKRYSHVLLPQAPSISIPKVPIAKSLSHNITLNNTNDLNNLTFTSQILNGKQELTKTESLPQNGILKNSTPIFINDRKLGIQHKSIKFRQTTTVIGEPEPLIVNN